MRQSIEKLSQILYPRRCPICEKIIVPKGYLICEECYRELPFVTKPYCLKCGKPITKEENEYCYDCAAKHFHYEYGYGMFVYDKKMQRSIAAFKYKNKREYGNFYSSEMVRHFREAIERMKIDVVVPIPIHKKKYKIRGYNQAEILAKGIADAMHLTLEPRLLIRCKNTLPQKSLNDRERIKNLNHAFQRNPNINFDCKDKRILLVDDIYTTGSTIEVCTKVLLDAGVDKVYFVCVCIGKGY